MIPTEDDRLPPPPAFTNPELDEIVATAGGFFWLEGDHHESTVNLFRLLARRLDRHVRFSESHLYTDRTRHICYGMLCASELNAFAYASRPGEVPAFDFIGINIGVVFTLLDAFGRILAHPDCFPEVGNRSLEDPALALSPELSTDLFGSGRPPCSPKCQVRKYFAGELAQVALDFLFFHEVTHLRNGHLEYLRELHPVPTLIEIVAIDDTDVAVLRQTLEFDADSGGSVQTLNEAFRMKDRLRTTGSDTSREAREALLSAYSDPVAATHTVLYAVYLLFRLFDDHTLNIESPRSHPQPLVRMGWIAPTIYEGFRRHPNYGYSANDFALVTPQVLIQAETDYGRVRGQPVDVRGLYAVYSDPSAAENVRRMTSTWSAIRPRLEPHCRGNGLPE